MLPGNHRFKSLNIDMVCWTRTKAILRGSKKTSPLMHFSPSLAVAKLIASYLTKHFYLYHSCSSGDPYIKFHWSVANDHAQDQYLLYLMLPVPSKKNITPKLHQCLIGMYSIWVGEACVISITHRKYERRIALTWWIQSPESIITIMVEIRECNYQSVIL